jgi:glutamyl-tRNA reductase
MGKLNHLSAKEREVVLALSQRLVNKILHHPTVRLKEHANGREGARYVQALRDLFGLSTRRTRGKD